VLVVENGSKWAIILVVLVALVTVSVMVSVHWQVLCSSVLFLFILFAICLYLGGVKQCADSMST
jgi:ABC-type multidrug transport system permease subunit